MNIDNYRLSRQQGLTWEIENKTTGKSVTFTEGRFDTTANSDNGADMEEFAEVAHDDNLEWLTYCHIPSRMSLIMELTDDTLAEAAYKLDHVVSPDDTGEYADADELASLLEPMTRAMREVVQLLTGDEIEELYNLVNAYWISPYNSQQWWQDVMNWLTDANKEYIRTSIGARIRDLRTQQHLSQQQLADLAGVTKANICNIERGAYSVGLDVLNKIATALHAEIQLISQINQ